MLAPVIGTDPNVGQREVTTSVGSAVGHQPRQRRVWVEPDSRGRKRDCVGVSVARAHRAGRSERDSPTAMVCDDCTFGVGAVSMGGPVLPSVVVVGTVRVERVRTCGKGEFVRQRSRRHGRMGRVARSNEFDPV